MEIRKFIQFFAQVMAVGLAAVIILFFVKPELLQPKNNVVEIVEAPKQATPSHDAAIGSSPVSYADAVKRATPAVVNVYTAKIVTERQNPIFSDPFFQRFFGQAPEPRQQLQTSLGSGVIFSEKGYILTNHHVIADADEIQVALNTGVTAEAKVVGTDPETDLAVLKINATSLPTITIANTEALQVGDVVLAIGNPYGVGQTVTMGIVSAKGRNRLGINTFENFIQTDAAINPGNSGGALINARGELVGINTAIFSKSGGSQGIGFAIPVNLASDVMQQIIENGHVVRGWLGIEGQDITPALRESFKLGDTQGVIVAGLLRNGPAALAGVKRGDIITHINKQPVRTARDILTIIAKTKPGDVVGIRLLRNGEVIGLHATVSERPQIRT